MASTGETAVVERSTKAPDSRSRVSEARLEALMDEWGYDPRALLGAEAMQWAEQTRGGAWCAPLDTVVRLDLELMGQDE